MNRLKPWQLSLLLLAGIVLATLGAALLYLYLVEADTVGAWSALSGILFQLLTLLPIFFGLGAALRLASRGELGRAIRLLAIILAAVFVTQTLIAFFDYLFYSDYVLWAAILFGLLGGLITGALHNGLLLAVLFFIPYLLFLRGESDGARGVHYATLAATVGYLLYRLIQQTVNMLVFLSEHFWIANRGEILSFVLYYLFDILLAAAAYFFLRFGRKASARFA